MSLIAIVAFTYFLGWFLGFTLGLAVRNNQIAQLQKVKRVTPEDLRPR